MRDAGIVALRQGSIRHIRQRGSEVNTICRRQLSLHGPSALLWFIKYGAVTLGEGSGIYLPVADDVALYGSDGVEIHASHGGDVFRGIWGSEMSVRTSQELSKSPWRRNLHFTSANSTTIRLYPILNGID